MAGIYSDCNTLAMNSRPTATYEKEFGGKQQFAGVGRALLDGTPLQDDLRRVSWVQIHLRMSHRSTEKIGTALEHTHTAVVVIKLKKVARTRLQSVGFQR